MKFTAPEFAQILSALQAAERAQRANERRRHCRIAVDTVGVPVEETATGRQYTALTRDISFHGVSLLQSWPPSTGTHIVVRLPRKRGAPDAIRCEVVYVAEMAQTLFTVGCNFLSAEGSPPAGGSRSRR